MAGAGAGADGQPPTESEVRAFVAKLSEFRATLPETDQAILDAVVMAAVRTREAGAGEVEGYDFNPAQWIFPPGIVDDYMWVRLSRECRIRGGVEVVLDPNSASGTRVWGCRVG